MTESQNSPTDEEWTLRKYTDMEYVCEDCGRVETFDGVAVKTRTPIRKDADCSICRMHLVNQEAYWNGEIEPDHIWSALTMEPVEQEGSA